MVHDVITVNGSIDRRKSLQSFARSAHEKPHKSKAGSIMDGFKLISILLTQLHQGRHVDLIKGSQHRCLLRGTQKPFSDTRPHATHGHSFLNTLAGWTAHVEH